MNFYILCWIEQSIFFKSGFSFTFAENVEQELILEYPNWLNKLE